MDRTTLSTLWGKFAGFYVEFNFPQSLVPLVSIMVHIQAGEYKVSTPSILVAGNMDIGRLSVPKLCMNQSTLLLFSKVSLASMPTSKFTTALEVDSALENLFSP